MDVILHVCCGPCTIYPLARLKQQGHRVTGYFYNPNIHPYREFKRRIGALVELSQREKFTVDIDRNYGLKYFLQQVVFNEEKRCNICYDLRLEQVAKYAAEKNAQGFSTTLLYSRYQNHQAIISKCEALAKKYTLSFIYEDYRQGWQEGINASIAMDLYRQPYCGCIYSEQERYDKKLRKKREKTGE